MQILFTIILVSFSMIYLFLKWMPAKGKEALQIWLSKHAPVLKPYFFFNAKNCSSGCSACGACAEPTHKTTKADQSKLIRIIPNP